MSHFVWVTQATTHFHEEQTTWQRPTALMHVDTAKMICRSSKQISVRGKKDQFYDQFLMKQLQKMQIKTSSAGEIQPVS